ncbi:hypothetical protein EV641_106298 [Rhodococcus sp. SMB37]|nr:hypothetical protein EV641_106298 [Rhodococcus sp. SMB37]
MEGLRRLWDASSGSFGMLYVGAVHELVQCHAELVPCEMRAEAAMEDHRT